MNQINHNFFAQILQEKKYISHNPIPPKVIIQILHSYKVQIFNRSRLNKHRDPSIKPLAKKKKS